MLTISLHGIKLHAPVGLYEQEQVLGNDFEVDVDVWMEVTEGQTWPFVDYVMIRNTVAAVFGKPELLLESLVQQIHTTLKERVGNARIRVAVRKYHPPMPGEVHYAQVCFEA